MKHNWIFKDKETLNNITQYKHYECKKCGSVKVTSVFKYHSGKYQSLNQFFKDDIKLGLIEPPCK